MRLKKIFVFLLVSVFMFSLVACTTKETDDEKIAEYLQSMQINYAEGDSLGSVTKDVSFTMMSVENLEITWESNNTNVIANDGKVTRPEEDTIVIITVTLKLNEATTSKIYNVTVIKREKTDYDFVVEYVTQIAITYAEGDNADSVTQDITLGTINAEDVTVTWTSDIPTIITDEGKVTRPDGDTIVKISVNIVYKTAEITKTFNLKVIERERTDKEIADQLLYGLDITFAENETADAVISDLTFGSLPTDSTATVTWTSNNTDIVANDGKITRGDMDTEVKITAEVTYNEEKSNKEFTVTVLKTPAITIEAAQAVAADTEVIIEGTIVGIYARGFLVKDDTGYMLVYLNAVPTRIIGDFVRVKGAVSVYNGKNQLTSTCTITDAYNGKVYELDDTVLDATTLEAQMTTPEYGKLVTVTALVTSVSSSYVNMMIENSVYALALAYPNENTKYEVGKAYTITGFVLYVKAYNNVNTLYLMADSNVEDYKYFVRESIRLIDAIGTVTINSKEAIDTAQAVYDKVLGEHKELVTNAAVLETAQETFKVLNIEALISAIGVVALTEESKALIDAAREAYNAIAAYSEMAAKVTNYATLTTAEETYAALEAESKLTKYTVIVDSASASYITTDVTGTEVSGGTEIEITVTAPDTAAKSVLLINNEAVEVTDGKAKYTVNDNITIKLVIYTLAYSTGFESADSFNASSTYNNTTEALFGPESQQWATFYGTVATTGAIEGSQSMQCRWYKSGSTNIGYIRSTFAVTNLGLISFNAANTSNIGVNVYTSTDNGTTWVLAKNFTLTTTSTNYEVAFATAIPSALVKFELVVPETNPVDKSRLYIDEVKLYTI